MVFEACNVFGSKVRIRIHAMFLEARLASGRHLLLYEPFSGSIFMQACS